MMLQLRDLPFITKIVAPRRRDDVILRPRLTAALEEGLSRRVQVLWASAGYGKTIALTELASRVEYPVAWYTLTPDDREPTDFTRYCIRAAESALRPLALVSPASGPSQDWRTLLGRLITALQQAETRLLFVIDDLHEVAAYSDVQEALSVLIERAPAGIRFVLAGRTKPTLRCLPRLGVEGQVAVHDAAILGFTAEETGALLSKFWGRDADPGMAEAITGRAGGWATGVALLAKAAPPMGQGELLWASDRTLFDYLTEEVLRRLPESHQEFLLGTSVLREFTAALADDLLGRADSATVLRELEQVSSFIEERAGSAVSFRYHALFRDYLERALKTRDPGLHVALHRKAAALAEARGDDDPALGHLVSALDFLEAGRLIVRLADSYLQRGRWQTLQAWLSALPGSLLDRDGELLLLQAKVSLRLGQPTAALHHLGRIAETASAPDKEILGRALVVRSFASRLMGDLDQAVQDARNGLDALRAANAKNREIAEGYRQLASALGTKGDYPEARHNLESALALAPDSDLQLRSLIHDGLAAACLELGQLDAAAVHLEKARQGWLRLGNQGSLAETLNNLAQLYYYRGEFEIALDEIGEALRAANAAGYRRLVATARISQGIVQRAQRRYNEALESFIQGLTEAREILDHRLVAEATNGLGNTYRRLGKAEQAEVLLQQALLEAEQSGQKYSVARYLISLGKVRLSKGAFNEAIGMLEHAGARFLELGNLRGLAEAKLHHAIALYRLHRTPDALRVLGEVDESLARLGYCGFLLVDGDEGQELLRLAVAKGIGRTHLAEVLGRLKGETPGVQGVGARTQGRLPLLRVFGFGQSRVFLEQHELEDHEWRTKKAKEMLFFLLCREGSATKDQLIDALWGEIGGAASEDTLRMTVLRLRRATYPEWVMSTSEGYAMNSEAPVEFDVARFNELFRDAERSSPGSDGRMRSLEQCVALYQGPFLTSCYSEWCETVRRALDNRYRRALTELAAYHLARGQASRAIEILQPTVASDPYDETAILLLARACVQAGDSLAALRSMRDYLRVAREELQALPSQEFIAVYNEILRRGPLAEVALS